MPSIMNAHSRNDDDLAQLIYRLRQESKNNDVVILRYAQCDFALNCATGEVEQKFITHQSVHSRVSESTSSTYINDIKTAHSLAAKIQLLENIKTMEDPKLQNTLKLIYYNHPNDNAATILPLLMNANTSTLQIFGFMPGRSQASSLTMEAIQITLTNKPLSKIATLAEAEQAWSDIQQHISAKLEARTKQKI